MANVDLVLYVIALVLFCCAAVGVSSRVNLTAAGLAVLTISLLV